VTTSATTCNRSTDFGQTWTSISGDLPQGRVARTIREDARNPLLLYLGTEMGLFVTLDGGQRWLSFRQNMPTVAVNDLVVHPRDQDLVLGTHGRGVWILDDVTALQELTPAVAASAAHLFTPQPGVQVRYTNLKAHMGDMVFRGENPPAGGIIDYWLGTEGETVSLSVHDRSGARVATLTPSRRRGVNRVGWNLRADDFVVTVPSQAPQGGRSGAATEGRGGRGGRGGGGSRLPGVWVPAGEYIVRLTAAGVTSERPMIVRDDPRITVSAEDRTAWTTMLGDISEVFRRAVLASAAVQASTGADPEARRLAGLLPARISGLHAEVGRYVGRPTADQRAQLDYYRSVAERLERARNEP
jgi:antitoxin (DNA-binding transcriptional repressor) of toxin-antitoxin stability system